MTELAAIENKISAIRKYLKILERYQALSQEEIENNVDRRGAVERYLYLACQAAIDLAEAFISRRNFRKPSTFGEAFQILQEEGIISPPLAGKLMRMAGFRNIIAHDYEIVSYGIVIDVLKHGLQDLEEFAKVITERC